MGVYLRPKVQRGACDDNLAVLERFHSNCLNTAGLAQQRAKGEVEDEEEDEDFQGEEPEDDVADDEEEVEEEEEEEEVHPSVLIKPALLLRARASCIHRRMFPDATSFAGKAQEEESRQAKG